MGTPIIKSGRFHAGTDLVCGENVVVDVAEECVVGDRCVLPDNAYLGGRSIRVGDDFYGYGWEWRRLDVGRGRRDDEHATLVVGNRCTFHDNRLDLACPVVVRDDVGLSPEVAVYTHGYWLSPLDGYPTDYAAVVIESGVIVGFRSTLLPGAHVRTGCVVGAGSVVVGELPAGHVCAGVPCKPLRKVTPLPEAKRRARLEVYAQQYRESLAYRGLGENVRLACDYPILLLEGTEPDWVFSVNASNGCWGGPECPLTDDLRDFLFRRGIRVYTQRPLKKLPRNGAGGGGP